MTNLIVYIHGKGGSVEEACFISPVLNREKLITDMMLWANVTEDELRVKGEIETAFGETLSWKYLCYVREHPVQWTVPTIFCTETRIV